MKNITYVAFAALLTMAPSVNADLITVGNIQTNDNDGTSIMTDTITGTMYSRLDETLKLTFSELTEELKADGKWDGWSFATSIESERLINAMLGGVSECDGYTSSQVIKCGTLKEEWQDGSLGASIDDGNDYWLYQSSLGEMTHGLGRIVADGNNSYVTKNDDLYKRIDADINIKTYSIGYLLYKNAPVVQATAPSSFSLLALGLIGFAARRFKKQS